jgi:glycosyltransferase involved in cell wall biosynthesis
LANRLAFTAAHEVWVLGRDMAAMIARNYGLASGRVRYVPHWSVVNIAHRRTAEATTLWRRLSLKEKFVVQYSGNMGLWHDMDTIIEAAALLEKDDTVHFLLIGSGIKRARAEGTARQTGLRNVTWLPYQKREDLADSLACCHAALISQMEGLEGVAVPCKLYGILASGRAVIAQAPAGAEVAQVVKEEQCGLVVPPGNAAKLAEAIATLAADRRLADIFGQRAFEAYQRAYTLERGADAFASGWSAWQNVGSPDSASTVAA